ncbi:hypothetical protein [Paenibacillus lutrae]|uniref:Uncharacterized protein n=1 Tax=Paenibacillus lutrae TaxID=2078573 RepID=A0A7X3FG32_9BACL|nr:hypothetical protein [Paenibacillus lutrae]MVO98833.1 hypothetical protein [Paenibacillus lutrae]
MNTQPFICLDMTSCLNNCGTTDNSSYQHGYLSSSGVSLPRENILFHTPFEFNDIPFVLFRQNYRDNMVTEGQAIQFPEARISKIHVLGASSDVNMSDYMYLKHNETLLSKEKMMLSHFASEAPFARNVCILETAGLNTLDGPLAHRTGRLWLDILHLTEPLEINQLTFEDNPCMHIFGITLER